MVKKSTPLTPPTMDDTWTFQTFDIGNIDPQGFLERNGELMLQFLMLEINEEYVLYPSEIVGQLPSSKPIGIVSKRDTPSMRAFVILTPHVQGRALPIPTGYTIQLLFSVFYTSDAYINYWLVAPQTAADEMDVDALGQLMANYYLEPQVQAGIYHVFKQAQAMIERLVENIIPQEDQREMQSSARKRRLN